MVRISTIGVVLAVLAAAAVASVTSNDASARPSGGSISLVAYSTPRDAYSQLIPAFQRTPAGQGTTFQQSYGASGEQARAVIAGLKADVVEFSLEPDMTSLVKAGLVAKSWKKEPFRGIVTRSVVVFVVRKGNPKHIRTWNDLVKPGVDVVVPNVQTGGIGFYEQGNSGTNSQYSAKATTIPSLSSGGNRLAFSFSGPKTST